jgi:hypothetical protein
VGKNRYVQLPIFVDVEALRKFTDRKLLKIEEK